MNQKSFPVGSKHHGFVVTRIEELPKLQNRLVQLTHEATGAKMIHLESADPNNLFAVAFPTNPQDSTGVAHILEHTALCGGKSYPVRDPFFSMVKRSLKTFMNAFTASDWTMYPFSTQNQKDFYNLLGVYLDAAFFPLLGELNFLQEGHRLEVEEPQNPDSPLVYKGVVYNEMLGAMSQPSQIMHRNLTRALFPTLTYHYNSGGDPDEIVKLSHQQLLDFHKQHYHPSNAYFFTYGNLPLEEHLAQIEAQVLAQFQKIEVHTRLPKEKRFSAPQSFEFTYPLEAGEDDGKKCQLALCWLTAGVTDSDEVLALNLMSRVLLGHSGAPLRKALLESKLGKALSDGTGFENEISETFFSAGLQGVGETDLPQVEALVRSTLNNIVLEGIKPLAIESALHQMEMETREITGGHYPYPLNLLFRFFGAWVHGGDPVLALDFDGAMERLHQKLQQPGYLESKIKTQLLDNPHQVRVTLKPEAGLEKEQQEKRQATLARIKAQLTQEETAKILEQTKALSDLQEAKEDLSVLPTLGISDIPLEVPFEVPVRLELEGRDVMLFEGATNGITYLQCGFALAGLSDLERSYLPLLGTLLTQTGKGDLGYEEMANRISLSTGGFSAGPSLRLALDQSRFEEFFTIGSKCLHKNLPRLFELLKKILLESRFQETERIHTLVGQRANSLSNSVIQAGHQYASTQASRGFSGTTRIEELYDGLSQVLLMKELAKAEPAPLLGRLTPFLALLEKLFVSERLSVFGLTEPGQRTALEEQILGFYGSLPAQKGRSGQPEPPALTPQYVREAWLTTTPVSYVAKAFKTPAYLSSEAPKLLVLSYLLKSEFLHAEIREKGGAYGGMAGYNAHEGILTLLSYRDPQLARTLEVYEQALGWLKKGDFGKPQVDEAILQCIGSMDTPQSPFGKALSEYGNLKKGKTVAHRLAFRKAVLETTKADLIEVGQRCLTGAASVAVVSSGDLLDKDQKALAGAPLERRAL